VPVVFFSVRVLFVLTKKKALSPSLKNFSLLVSKKTSHSSRHYYTTPIYLSNIMVNAPRTVKDTPANEFVISLAQYFRSSGKVRRRSNALS
jgi:hypothetical protein